MRTRFLVAYDIRDDARLRLVHRIMRGFGDRLQYSVFVCDLSPMEKVQLLARISAAINPQMDRIVIAHLGSSQADTGRQLEFLGQKVEFRDREAYII